MPFQAVPNVAQIRVEGVVDSQLTINDLYFEISGGGITAVNLEAITDAVFAWHSGEVTPNLSQDWSLVRCVGIDLTAADGAEVITSGVTPGGADVEAAPNNVAACISFRTANRGRSFRGRNYIPGIPNDQVTLNTLETEYLATLQAAYALLIGAGTFVAGWQFVVVSRFAAGVQRAEGIATPVLTVQFTTPYVRSMRSREIGHGA
jgi:hypothetical protein